MPYWLQFTFFALIAGLVQYIVSYFTEKGKNLATKEDIATITKEVESVKSSYNESLERHKIELQKEFEESKYIMSLCQSLDKELIELIIACLKESSAKIFPDDDSSLFSVLSKLDKFMQSFKWRYDKNETLNQLSNIAYKIEHEWFEEELRTINTEAYRHNFFLINAEDKKKLVSLLRDSISLMLPQYNITKAEF